MTIPSRIRSLRHGAWWRAAVVGIVTIVGSGAMIADEAATPVLERGTPHLASARALAFGPDGVLLIGDALGAKVIAVDVADDERAEGNERFDVADVDRKIAAALGVQANDLVIHDLAVHPNSQALYLALSRGRDADAVPAIVRLARDGALQLVSLTDVPYAEASIGNAPGVEQKDQRGRSLRTNTITDLAYHDGRVYVAGLSNEEFASSLRVLRYPLDGAMASSSLEIFHGAHGRYETHAPIRSLVPVDIGGESHLVAGYTCTPLVTFPLDGLEDGQHVKGKTIAELGNRNVPLDLLTLEQDGKTYLLVLNSSRSGMKIDLSDVSKAGAITQEVEGMTAGTPYVPLPWGGIVQIAELNDYYLIALRRGMRDSGLSVQSVSKRRI